MRTPGWVDASQEAATRGTATAGCRPRRRARTPRTRQTCRAPPARRIVGTVRRLRPMPRGLQGSDMGEERHTLPPSLRGVPFNSLVRRRRLSQTLRQKSSRLEGCEVFIERVGPSAERHLHTISSKRGFEVALPQVRAFDDEGRSTLACHECASVIKWVGDRDAQPTTRPQHARRLEDGSWHVFDVHQGVLRHHEFERSVQEGQDRCVPLDVATCSVRSAAYRTIVGDSSIPTTLWPLRTRSRTTRPSQHPSSRVHPCGGGRSE